MRRTGLATSSEWRQETGQAFSCCCCCCCCW